MEEPSSRAAQLPASKGPRELRKEVLDAGLCTVCGMCLRLCPYLDEMGGHVAFLSDCTASQGRCYAVCPRTDTDLDGLRRLFLPSVPVDYVLGPHQTIWISRARKASLRRRGQYGATVTALALFGLETGRSDAALLTDWSSDPGEPALPRPTIARSAREVLDAAGSKYTACPTLKLIDQAVREEARKLFVVGRPCQILALRKRTTVEDPTFPGERIALAVGLFCMWSVSYRAFRRLLEPLLKGKLPKRIDIPKGRFLVNDGEATHELPHESLRSLARDACRTCYDFTAELADVSVGSTEWKDDWNTLIVRNESGRAFVEAAVAEGWIQVKPMPPERIQLLREAAFNKKKRTLEALRRVADQEPYLNLASAEWDFFKQECPPTHDG